nr:probable acyl-activating enzyme 6 [Ipomoea batatas]
MYELHFAAPMASAILNTINFCLDAKTVPVSVVISTGTWYEEAKEMRGGDIQKRWSQRMKTKEGRGGRSMRSKDGLGRDRNRMMRSEEVKADDAVRGRGSGAGG